MRKQPTRSEDLLWAALRNRSLAGRKFRRQHPVGRFIIYFLRLPAALVKSDLAEALAMIERAFGTDPSPVQRERGDPQGRGEGL
ncbi:MAG: DUF559 domain-containing protein [Dehalococcoidia bacterium]|nr:DUF559 domain-containing protein [Dehalococcoidia bacterium]